MLGLKAWPPRWVGIHFVIDKCYFSVGLRYTWLTYDSVGGRLTCFHFELTVTNTAVTICTAVWCHVPWECPQEWKCLVQNWTCQPVCGFASSLNFPDHTYIRTFSTSLLCKRFGQGSQLELPRLSPAMELLFRYMGRGHFICWPVWTFEVPALINRAVCNLSEDADYWLKPMTLTAEFLIFIDFAL